MTHICVGKQTITVFFVFFVCFFLFFFGGGYPFNGWIQLLAILVRCINSLRPGQYICVSKLTIISSDNDLSPGRRQAIIWTNAGVSLTDHLGTNFSEILIKIYTFSFKKMQVKVSSGKWRPFCLGLNELNHHQVKILRWLFTLQSRISWHNGSSVAAMLCNAGCDPIYTIVWEGGSKRS